MIGPWVEEEIIIITLLATVSQKDVVMMTTAFLCQLPAGRHSRQISKERGRGITPAPLWDDGCVCLCVFVCMSMSMATSVILCQYKFMYLLYE